MVGSPEDIPAYYGSGQWEKDVASFGSRLVWHKAVGRKPSWALYDAHVTAELLRNLLTKDYLIQKNMLTEVMPGQGNSKSASYSIGDKFSSLLALKERLENEE